MTPTNDGMKQQSPDPTQGQSASTVTRQPTFAEVISAPLAELLFVVLPLIVVAIVSFFSNEHRHGFLSSPEWSFGAAVLFGQSITKLITAAMRLRESPFEWAQVTLTAAGIIVVGLVPSLTALSLLLTTADPSGWLVALQIALFVLGAVAFLVFGVLGHLGLFHADDILRRKR